MRLRGRVAVLLLFFAIVPLLALAIGVLGFVYGTDRASRELAGVLREVYPVVGGEEMNAVPAPAARGARWRRVDACGTTGVGGVGRTFRG